MHTPEFKIYFVGFVHVQTLMALRGMTKGWNAAADVLIDEGVKSGVMMVHDGNDIEQKGWEAREERRKLVTWLIFLLNVTKVGEYVCKWAVNLIVVDIPEGVESISDEAFVGCSSLTTVSFPTTLTSIGDGAFCYCSSLDNIDLLNTNLQHLGQEAFNGCSELTSMTVLDSLQTLDYQVFYMCFKLIPSNINVGDDNEDDPTSQVVAYLCTKQMIIKRWALPLNDDFYRYVCPFLSGDTLMALRLVTKGWNSAAETSSRAE